MFYLTTIQRRLMALIMKFIEDVLDAAAPLVCFHAELLHVEGLAMGFLDVQVKSRVAIILFWTKTQVELSLHCSLGLAGLICGLSLLLLRRGNALFAIHSKKIMGIIMRGESFCWRGSWLFLTLWKSLTISIWLLEPFGCRGEDFNSRTEKKTYSSELLCRSLIYI